MNLHLITLIIIGIIFPIYSIATGQKARNLLIESPEMKIPVYKQTILLQVVFIVLITISMWLSGNKIHDIGLSFIYNPVWILAIPTTCLLILWLLNKRDISDKNADKFLEDSKDVMYILPSNDKEYRWTIALSLIAGTFEEIIFRGYLFWQIEQYIPTLPAILITNIIFGLSHYGTKFKNAFSAFILGIVWSASYYLTGTLWWAIVIHICIDFYSSTTALKSIKLKRATQQ